MKKENEEGRDLKQLSLRDNVKNKEWDFIFQPTTAVSNHDLPSSVHRVIPLIRLALDY